jgi:hypothetical protein
MTDNVAKIMHDTVCVAAFVAMAIAFSRWWLVFFALIFFMWPSNISSVQIADENEEDNDG